MSSLYRHTGVAVVRAAVRRLDDGVAGWPEPTDEQSCRSWLALVWAERSWAEAIRQASPVLASRVDALQAGEMADARQVCRAAMSVMRYVLRAGGRHTPFGLFAGAAPAGVGARAMVSWGDEHRPVARVDAPWLADVIDQLEACPDLLCQLEVVFNNLAVRRGERLEVPRGASRVSVRWTRAVQAVRQAALVPIPFADLASKLGDGFPASSSVMISDLLTELVRQGLLITSLRAPMTVTDPLGHLLDRLKQVDAETAMAEQLRTIHDEVARHNEAKDTAGIRRALTTRMRALSGAGRTPLAVDLCLDCEVQVPEAVAEEMALAAGALARLSRQPTGEAAWRDYYTAFCERYGTGTVVPLSEVVNPDSGLGLPAGYPGSVLPSRTSTGSTRDAVLLALAWQAMADDRQEVLLDDDAIESLVVDSPGDLRAPPHVELAARVHATSVDALQRGDFVLTVAPARSFGTLTSRIVGTADSELARVYAYVPTSVEGSLPVQLSFPPAFPHAENICRVPAYLPHVLALGEHRGLNDAALPLDDLAVIADHRGLHLVSLSRQRVVEPQVFHGLALEKQPPPLARFLIHLSRGLGVAWHAFDWGAPAQQLAYLPRVRYRRSVLSPARWRLSGADLAAEPLDRWRNRWRCPATVELRDADRTLRLDLTITAHVAVLEAHLRRHGHAVLTETVTDPADYGWLDGHAHEIVLPLVSTRPAAPSPMSVARPLLTNRCHGQLPGSADTSWLNAMIHTHPERMDELIADHLPRLGSDRAYWFIRYRSAFATDHLRLRLRTTDAGDFSAALAAVGGWAQELLARGLIGRLLIDTYYPEVGRYGAGRVMAAAEDVFVADSRAVVAQLRHLPALDVHRDALAVANLVATIHGLLGATDRAMWWLASRLAPHGSPVDRIVLDQAMALVTDKTALPGEIAETWQARHVALTAYGAQLPGTVDDVLESLLHMQHNRFVGIDREREASCRRLARRVALAWIARHGASG